MQVWIPTFLVRLRGPGFEGPPTLTSAINIVIINGIGATLLGRLAGPTRLAQTLLRARTTTRSSGIAMLIRGAVSWLADHLPSRGSLMFPAMFYCRVFVLLVGTGSTTNAAPWSNSRKRKHSFHHRALAVKRFVYIHLLGRCFFAGP